MVLVYRYGCTVPRNQGPFREHVSSESSRILEMVMYPTRLALTGSFCSKLLIRIDVASEGDINADRPELTVY